MEKLIRIETDAPKTSGLKGRVLSILGIVLFSLCAVAASGGAAWLGKEGGMPPFILMVGVAVVSIIAVLSIILNWGRTLPETEFGGTPIGSSGVIEASFEALRLPSLVMKDGKPILANAAYMTLAKDLGVAIVDDEPPAVDLLFSKNQKDAAAAIFRLHHTSQESGVGTETVRTMAGEAYRAFTVIVTPLAEGQLWEIEDQAQDGGTTSPLLVEAPVGLFSVHENGRILEMNGVLRRWLGYKADKTPELISDFIENPETLLDSPKTSGRIVRGDAQLKTLKGVNSPTVMSGSWHDMETGHMYASVAVYGHSGLGARAASGTQIASSLPSSLTSSALQDNMQTAGLDILGEAPFGIVQLDCADLSVAKILGANAAFTYLTDQRVPVEGMPDLLFKSIFAPDAETEAFINAGVHVDEGPQDIYLANQDGAPVNVYFSQNRSIDDDTGGVCLAYMIDISKRKELEDNLMQAHKMQAIGQLAGGVAHDFNNLLTVIRLNTDELLGRHPIGDPSYPELQQINQTVARSAGLVRKLLAFSRKQTMRVEVLNVTDALSDLTVMLQRVMVERIKLDVVHGRGLPAMQADKTQLETILMNLCVNARDAMVEKGGGGAITLSSSHAKVEDYAQDDITMPKEGGFIIIKVADTGTGMDAQTQKKIFEPFFTTKEQGKGTGLGLATVYGIVEQSGGHLRVESKLGVGTTFRVYIPTASEAEERQQREVAAAKPIEVKPSDLAGQGRILFVEDEDAVRAIAAKTLRKRGYTVIEACDGEEAYEMLEEGETFDLMLSDVVMPGMDGPTLLKKGRTLLGDAKIVFISGYAEEEFSELLAEEPDVTFLPKPFTLTQLAEKVKSVIGDAD